MGKQSKVSTAQSRSNELSRSPILDRTHLYRVKKMCAFIGYGYKNIIVFDCSNEYRPETQFGIKCIGFLQPSQNLNYRRIQ